MNPLSYLSGVRVLDLSRILAGPYAGSILAELGADVIKVEGPDGDPARHLGPFHDGESLYFGSLNRGKRGIVLDLSTAGGREALYRLTADADILLHNFHPKVAARLGVAAQVLHAHRPELIVATVSSYGSDTAHAGTSALDVVVQADAGIMSVTGRQGHPPVRAGVPVGDLMAGMWVALGATAALAHRHRTGRGTHLEVPLFDATLATLTYIATAALATGVEPGPVGSGHHSAVPYGAFPARDGWVALGLIGDRLFPAFCDALDLTELGSDARLNNGAARLAHRARIEREVAARTVHMDRHELVERLRLAGVPAAPVHTVLEALRSPYVQQRGLVVPVSGHADYEVVRSPVPSARTAISSAPTLGQHTAAIMGNGW